MKIAQNKRKKDFRDKGKKIFDVKRNFVEKLINSK
jgi:hypothetical protein